MSTIMRAFTVMERLTTPPRDTTTFSSRKEEAKMDKRKERTGRKLRIYERIYYKSGEMFQEKVETMDEKRNLCKGFHVKEKHKLIVIKRGLFLTLET